MSRALFALLLAVGASLAVAAFAGQPVVLLVALGGLAVWVRFERPAALVSLPAWSGPALIVLVVGAVTAPTLQGDFLADDYGYLQLFDRKSLPSFLRLGDISEGIWGQPLDELRPVFAFSYKLGMLWHGADARGLHLDNLLVHLANCLLVYGLLRALEPRSRIPALAAGLFFGLLPVHAEPIAWITGKVDSLPTLFYLAALLLFVRFRKGAGALAYASALGVFALGLFSKEILITLPAVLLTYDLLLGGPPQVRALLTRHMPFVALTLAFLVLRRTVFDTFAREGRASSPERVWLFVRAQPEKLRWLLAPFERFTPLELVAAGLTLGIIAGAAACLWRHREEHTQSLAQAAFLGCALYGITLAPLLVTYSSARHLYLPSVGVAGALALLLFPVADAGPRPQGRLALCGSLLLTFGFGLQLLAAQERWTQAGAIARQARLQLEQHLRPLPPGTPLVIEGFPASDGPLPILKFSLPFALQPPFAARDAYTPYRVIETPDIYCCPLSRWWQDKRRLVQALVTGHPDEPVGMALAHWNERRGEVVVRQGRPLRGFLRRQVERALGAPLEQVEQPDAQGARRLVSALAEAVRVAGPGQAGFRAQ